MRRIIIFTLCVIFITSVFGKSPHGKDFAIKCVVCHTTDNWTKIKMNGYDHYKSDFPLIGQHKTVDCRKCHIDLNFKIAKRDCSTCHKDVHELTLGMNCERCHTPASWIVNNIIQIHQQSRFPLVGAHAQIDCNLCHKSASLLRFDPMRSECIACHLKDFNATTNPNHVSANLPKECIQCHNQQNWTSATFNHNATAFPLTGAHTAVSCTSCHKNGFGPIPTTCVSCHLANFNATTNPNHVSAKFSTDCQTCHSTTAWSPSTFNHSTSTSFPLTGAHIAVDCVTCHKNGYGAIPTTCVSCHLENYNSTTNPDHIGAKFSTDCKTCHTTITWAPANFNHNTATSFPLTGAHIRVACYSCHANGFAGIPTTCVSCHLVNYNATTNPNHITAKFPTTCESCHTTTAWVPSTFNHSTATTFPLTGAHSTVTCSACHPTGYTAIPATCVSCHLTTYNATTNPNHVTAKFPTTCETCHSSSNWTSSTFNHSTSTTFPLTGSHVALACNLCHPKNYNAIPTTCVSCHLAKYNATTNPNHIGAKFGTTCETCHTTTNWTSATFNHNTVATIPLTGNHNLSCSTCHTTPTNYTIFSCRQTACHANAHNAAQGSIGCYQCHPSGRAG